MIIETNNKTVNLVLTTKKIVEIASILKSKNFEKAFMEAYSICDPVALSKILYKIAENEKEESFFTNTDEVYDFIDECRKSGMTINNIYEKITEALNEEGFFKKKMNKKELKEMMSNPLLTTDMDKLVQKSAENAITQIAEKEFQGYMA